MYRSKLHSEENGACNSRGCSPSDKSRCEISKVMCSTKQYMSHVTNKGFMVSFPFSCDSSNVVYLLQCSIYDLQYVGYTCTPFKLRFNSYKACNRKFLER